jgi:hypothetical protein
MGLAGTIRKGITSLEEMVNQEEICLEENQEQNELEKE